MSSGTDDGVVICAGSLSSSSVFHAGTEYGLVVTKLAKVLPGTAAMAASTALFT
jgi:hypothetical protein